MIVGDPRARKKNTSIQGCQHVALFLKVTEYDLFLPIDA